MKNTSSLRKISLAILLLAFAAINSAKLSPELANENLAAAAAAAPGAPAAPATPLTVTSEASVTSSGATASADAEVVSSVKSQFVKLDFNAIDIGCGSEGDICAVGVDSVLYCYDFMANNWIRFSTEEISDITRVDVDDDGTVYVIADCGIYYLDCFNRWIKLPGRGKDIGVGVNFDVYKIGLDEHICEEKKNYGIWKLFCDCPCKCDCTRQCMRFRFQKIDYCLNNEIRKCFWFRVDGWGINIDVFPNGEAVVTQANGEVHLVDFAGTFRSLKNNKFFATDVTVGNDGVIYASSLGGDIYKRIDSSFTAVWESKDGLKKREAKRLCASSYDQVWYINKLNKHVYTGSRYKYVD